MQVFGELSCVANCPVQDSSQGNLPHSDVRQWGQGMEKRSAGGCLGHGAHSSAKSPLLKEIKNGKCKEE